MRKKMVKYMSKIIWCFIFIFGILILSSALYYETGREIFNPVYVVGGAIVLLVLYLKVHYSDTDSHPSDLKIYKVALDQEQEDFNTAFDIDKYIENIEWLITEKEDEIVLHNGLYLFKGQGRDKNYVFYYLYGLEKGEMLWKYFLDNLSRGWSDIRPIGYHIIEGNEKVKNFFIMNWMIFEDSNILDECEVKGHILTIEDKEDCLSDSRYTSKKEIEKLANINLPDFKIKERNEALTDFTGNYIGEAMIEFCKIIDDSIIRQINDDMSKGDSRWRKSDNNDEYICGLIEPDLSSTPSKDEYWRLILRRDSNMGQIAYGRI
jgi:hypothetical protein